MLDKTYRPAEVEARLDRLWEAGGYFRPSPDPERPPYCIVMPPPNVTGSLHMGHALDNTIQDTLVRFWRMRGRAVLWQPGTDHAGIATQMVVERQLEGEGLSRREIGRAGLRRADLGVEGAIGRRHQPAVAPARRVGRLVARALHARPGPVARGPQGLRRPLPRGPDLQGQAPGQLGLPAADRGLRPRGRGDRGRRPAVVPPLSARRSERPPHHGRDHPARDHARRHRGRGPPRGSALPRPDRPACAAAARRPPPADHRRPLLGPGERLGRGQDHACSRLQRLRGRPPSRPRDDQYF